MHGLMGKRLQVNLTSSAIKSVPVQPYAERYLGGRGIASRIYWETVPPGIRGWDEETGLPRAETLAALGLDDLIPLCS